MITGEHKLTYGRIGLSSIHTGARRRLAKRLVDIDDAFLLSINQDKNYLLLLLQEADSWKLVEDTAADPSRGQVEVYHELAIDPEGLPVLCRLAQQAAEATPSRPPGRPAVYDDAKEGQDIYVAHVYEGKSIRTIAKDMKMSPSTVQKILNRVRFQVADKLVAGELSLTPDPFAYGPSLDVLRWAMKNSEGELQEKYRTFLRSVL